MNIVDLSEFLLYCILLSISNNFSFHTINYFYCRILRNKARLWSSCFVSFHAWYDSLQWPLEGHMSGASLLLAFVANRSSSEIDLISGVISIGVYYLSSLDDRCSGAKGGSSGNGWRDKDLFYIMDSFRVR